MQIEINMVALHIGRSKNEEPQSRPSLLRVYSKRYDWKAS
jgi:hypothetical protein